jgi:catechol 2,3-dioxygenase-like lactoylglutathione lyase family enzyme
MMTAIEHRPGAVFWIDHYVLPVNDLTKAAEFMENVLGGKADLRLPLTTEARLKGVPIGMFYLVGRYHHIGLFLQDKMLPAPKPLGEGTPRYGYFIRESDVDFHLNRLDKFQVQHSQAVKTSEAGEEGTAIYFMDRDGNQFEFWAPRQLPPGAMESDNPLRVGRISHAVVESRDLSRTAEFHARLNGIDPIRNDDVAKHLLPLRLAGGGRLVYKHVGKLYERTCGHNIWKGAHLAFTVPDDEFVDSYNRFWANLPECERGFANGAEALDENVLMPRTELHGVINVFGKPDAKKRGTYIYDPDTTGFHLMGGIPLDREFAHYDLGWSDTKLLQVEIDIPRPAA